jgi:DNA-directed DNA polymerase III PolC
MIGRAIDIDREYFTYTDLGHLSSFLKAYGMAKKSGLKFAGGIEFYLKDPKCSLVTGTKADRCKYFTSTLFVKNQDAYQALVKVVSRTDLPKIEIQEEEQSLWSWDELESLSKFDTLLVLGGPHCMVGKVLLADGPELAERVLLKAKDLFGDRLSLSLICEKWDRKFASVIKIDYTDGSHDSVLASDTLSTERARKIKASDLITRGGHYEIKSKIVGNTYFEVNKKIRDVSEHKGFLPLPVDMTLEMNKFFVNMGKKYDIQLLVSDYAFYAERSDHIVQTMILEGKTKLKSDLHMKTEEEFGNYLQNTLKLGLDESVRIMMNNDSWAKNFDNFELKYELKLTTETDNPLKECMAVIKKNGRMKWDNPIYVSRLREEITVICNNSKRDLSAYFLPIADIVEFYKENGQLTGPGRGSCAGSLFCFLLGISHLDPIVHGLSFPRFLSLDRLNNGDIPDIDQDFGSRELLTGKDKKSGYLYGRWGNKVAQASTRHKVRLKSAVKDTNRYFNGSVEKEIELLSKALPDPPQGVPDQDFVFGYEDTDGNYNEGIIDTCEPLKKYIASRPKEWEIVQKSLGLTRAFSQHASAYIISDGPISDVLPTKEGHITQYEAKQCEAAGQIKFDFLTVSNIKDIEICLNLINKKNGESNTIGYFTHKDKLEYIWDLPNDPGSFKSVWGGNTESCFQISSNSMKHFVKEILPKTVDDISVILALDRPGPLDYIDEETGRSMAEEYIWRHQGKSKSNFKELSDMIPETYGILCFQEQNLLISKELGGMTPGDAEKLRRLFSKKEKKLAGEMKPIFMSTAVAKIGEEKASKIWDMLEASSRYNFNLSHSKSYAMITYACMFLRHNYPLEWWAAILTNAKEKEISGKLWPHVKHILAPPDINLSSDEMEIDYANGLIRAKLGVVRGMGEKTIDPIVAGRPYKDIQDFVNREVAGPGLARKLTHVGVLDSLYPPKLELLQKMQLLEDATEIRKFNQKLEKAALEEKTIKATEAKKGVIPEEYLNIEKDPMKNAAIKKSILPSLLVGLYDLGQNYSKCIPRTAPSKMMRSPTNHRLEVLLINGERLQALDERPGDMIPKDLYVAVCAFVVSTSIFDYKKNTKQALKVVLDVDGVVGERICWPQYPSGDLVYPKELKKGQIATVFLKKRANSNDICSIQEIVIEA